MAKRNREKADVQLIPYYEYDPAIHNIEYRYFEDLTDYYADHNSYIQEDDYRRPRPRRPRPPYGGGFYGGGFGRPPFYPPVFPLPLPLPVPVPRPYPYWGGSFYGGYPYGGGYWKR